MAHTFADEYHRRDEDDRVKDSKDDLRHLLSCISQSERPPSLRTVLQVHPEGQ